MTSQTSPSKGTPPRRRPPRDDEFYTINNAGKAFQEDDSVNPPDLWPIKPLRTTRHQAELAYCLRAVEGRTPSLNLGGLEQRIKNEIRHQQELLIEKAAAVGEDMNELDHLIQVTHARVKLGLTKTAAEQTATASNIPAAMIDKLHNNLVKLVQSDESPIKFQLELFASANDMLEKVLECIEDCGRLVAHIGQTRLPAHHDNNADNDDNDEVTEAPEATTAEQKQPLPEEAAVHLPIRQKATTPQR